MNKIVLDATKMSLEEWLGLLFNSPEDVSFMRARFPTDKHCEQYLAKINEKSEDEVCQLLINFLIKSGDLYFTDQINLETINSSLSNKQHEKSRQEYIRYSQYYKRLIKNSLNGNVSVWEGITWILDLLPRYPKQAIDTLMAYLTAHIQVLPDGRIDGILDAVTVIRAKFIDNPISVKEKLNFLRVLSPRDFESLVARLYQDMGYEVKLTPFSKDGGYDILARKGLVSQRLEVLVECKQYAKPVGVEIIRSLMGVISSGKANKGVVVTTSHFTKGAREFVLENSRLELINGDELVKLLNEYLGSRWPLQIEKLISRFVLEKNRNE